MFNPFAARCVGRVRSLNNVAQPTVVEFGNQRYGAKGVIRGTEAATTTEQFYKLLGFSRYLALDVNTDMGAEIVDLNELIGQRLGQFDLVTNNGTGEHIFDQSAVFTNVHDLCRVGGVMLHVMPFSPWINHGFYTFQPILFRDLAAVNNYEILFVCVGDRDDVGSDFLSVKDAWLFVEKNPTKLRNYMASKRSNTQDLLIGVALRKTRDEPFRKPLQGKYQSAIESDGLRDKYKP